MVVAHRVHKAEEDGAEVPILLGVDGRGGGLASEWELVLLLEQLEVVGRWGVLVHVVLLLEVVGRVGRELRGGRRGGLRVRDGLVAVRAIGGSGDGRRRGLVVLGDGYVGVVPKVGDVFHVVL